MIIIMSQKFFKKFFSSINVVFKFSEKPGILHADVKGPFRIHKTLSQLGHTVKFQLD